MFANKNYLLLLIIVPLFAALFSLTSKRRKSTIREFVGNINLLSLREINFNSYKVKNILFLVGISLIVIALARPQYGQQNSKAVRQFSEIVVALDISNSMLAQDFNPSRLEIAKSIILDVVDECPGERIGVIIFSGSAMWQCPMTHDLQALKMLLKNVETDNLPSGGTQIGEAIIIACKSLSSRLSKNKAMVLISDGEDHESKINDAIATAKKNNLKIICVAIGTVDGAPIPIMDENKQVKSYMTDRYGKIVMSKVNVSLLQKISQETGGKFFDATNKAISSDLTNTLKNFKQDNEIEEINNKVDRFQIFVFFGLICLISSLIYPVRRKK